MGVLGASKPYFVNNCAPWTTPSTSKIDLCMFYHPKLWSGRTYTGRLLMYLGWSMEHIGALCCLMLALSCLMLTHVSLSTCKTHHFSSKTQRHRDTQLRTQTQTQTRRRRRRRRHRCRIGANISDIYIYIERERERERLIDI